MILNWPNLKKIFFTDFKMKKQGLPIILILMMLITPIASAFEHCAGMDMSESQSFSMPYSVDDTTPLDHKKMLKESQNKQTDMDCHSCGNCTVHICGGYGITSSPPTINTVTSSYYSSFEYALPYSSVLSTELRPPISIL